MLKLHYKSLFSRRSSSIWLLIFAFSIAVVSCKPDDDGGDPQDEFDRKAMLLHTGKDIIIYSYNELDSRMTALGQAIAQFSVNTNEATLNTVRAEWELAYLQWERCSPFEFGPAADVLLRASLNTFPVDTSEINSNIANGSWNLASATNIDAKGFPSMDYLLFGDNLTDGEIVNLFLNDVNRVNYLQDVFDEMDAKIDEVNTAWAVEGGNYLDLFANNTGTDAGSSISVLVNQLNFDYELTKNARVGIPFGKKTLGIPQPEKVEAFYSGISLKLLRAHLDGIEDLYRGNGSNDGLGLDDNLIVINARHSNQPLHDAISAQITAVDEAFEAVDGTLVEAITSDPQDVEDLYQAVQQNVILFKTDMPSALGVLITYQDNDGD